MRILVAGDTHKDLNHWNYLADQTAKHDIDIIVQVGDFGYWRQDYEVYLDYLDRVCRRYDIKIFWLDGNHEDHPHLRRTFTEKNSEGFIPTGENVFYIPRGHSWTWDDVKFVAMGGAYSVDKERRKVGVSWFPEEMIEQEEVDLGVQAGKVDVMFCHDVPSQADINVIWMAGKTTQKIQDERWGRNASKFSNRNRHALGELANATQPSIIVHGHLHIRCNQYTRIGDQETQIISLSCNGSRQDSFTILDTNEIKLENAAANIHEN